MSKAIWGLDQFDLFDGLNPTELQSISSIITKRNYRKGDIVTDQTDKSRDIFVLLDGRIDIISLQGIQLYRISRGETFGELALIPKLKRTAVAVAREDSIAVILNVNHLEAFGEEYPSIYKTITTNIVNSLGIKLARANKLIELLKAELSKSMRQES